MITNDPRRGLPSASEMPRIALCKASHRRSKKSGTIPAQPVNNGESTAPNPWAATGDKIHAWLAAQDCYRLKRPVSFCPKLNQDELQMGLMCLEQRDSVLDAIFPGQQQEPVFEIVEQRLWLMRGKRPRFSGQFDWLGHRAGTALLVDYKTLYGEHDEAPDNDQLRSLAALIHKNLGVDHLFAAMIQPARRKQPLVTEFSREELIQSLDWLESQLAQANDKDALATPGEKQCRWCPANNRCPECHKWAVLADVPGFAVLPTKEEIEEKLALLDPKQLAELVRRRATINAIIDGASGRLKQMAPEALSSVGLVLKDHERTDYPDTQAVWDTLAIEWGPSDILRCLKFTMTGAAAVITEKNMSEDALAGWLAPAARKKPYQTLESV